MDRCLLQEVWTKSVSPLDDAVCFIELHVVRALGGGGAGAGAAAAIISTGLQQC